MGSFSRSRPFLRTNYTVDTCYVVSATKTNFLSWYFASETLFSRLCNNTNTFMVGIGDISIIYL